MLSNVLRASLLRAAGFLAFWLMLFGVNPTDLPMGALTAAAATWASLRLLPPGPWRLRPGALARLALRFLGQSIVAGADVVRRALDPRLPLRPGFVAFPVYFPPGAARNAFATLTSLLPGTVPAGEESGQLVYHCLDTDQPVSSQLAAEEAALAGQSRMTEFLTAALGFILAMLALGLDRILRGPGDADRMMAAQLIGTGGIAALLLLGAVTGVPAAIDVALTLALLATFASIAFVKKGTAGLGESG
jgi:multicomponent Na+:H+ antiporter subunit E